MIQDAILFTKDNAEMIAAHLTDYQSAEMLLEDYGHMFNSTHDALVLARDIPSNGQPVLSYVIFRSYFEVNNPAVQLNDKTFTVVHSF